MIWLGLKRVLYVVVDVLAWVGLIAYLVTEYRTGGWHSLLTYTCGVLVLLVVVLTVVAVFNFLDGRAERYWRAAARRDR